MRPAGKARRRQSTLAEVDRPPVTIPPVRKLRRMVFNTLATLSLLLCVAACVMWARSYRRWDTCSWVRGLHVLAVASAKGEMAFAWETDASEAVSQFWRR